MYFVAALSALFLTALPMAADANDNGDWPCIQRLVPELTAAQMWSGPPLDSIDGYWQADAEIAPLAFDLIDLDVPTEEAEAKVADFASGIDDPDRGARLTMLFAAVLESVNGERDQVIDKIKSYAARQNLLADRISADNAALQGIRLDREPDERQRELLAVRERRDWDLRIFDDRSSLLTPICEQPVRLEQRAFALARAIQAHL